MGKNSKKRQAIRDMTVPKIIPHELQEAAPAKNEEENITSQDTEEYDEAQNYVPSSSKNLEKKKQKGKKEQETKPFRFSEIPGEAELPRPFTLSNSSERSEIPPPFPLRLRPDDNNRHMTAKILMNALTAIHAAICPHPEINGHRNCAYEKNQNHAELTSNGAKGKAKNIDHLRLQLVKNTEDYAKLNFEAEVRTYQSVTVASLFESVPPSPGRNLVTSLFLRRRPRTSRWHWVITDKLVFAALNRPETEFISSLISYAKHDLECCVNELKLSLRMDSSNLIAYKWLKKLSSISSRCNENDCIHEQVKKMSKIMKTRGKHCHQKALNEKSLVMQDVKVSCHQWE